MTTRQDVLNHYLASNPEVAAGVDLSMGDVQSYGNLFARGVGSGISGPLKGLVDAPLGMLGFEDVTPGASLQRKIEESFPVNPEVAHSTAGTVVEGAGALASLVVPAGLAAKVGGRALEIATAAGQMGLSQAGAGAEEARSAGATPAAIFGSYVANGAIGSAMAFPVVRLFDKLDAASGGAATKALSAGVGKPLAAGITSAIDFAAVSIAGQVGSNAAAKVLYDAHRELTQGWKETATSGGILGFAAGVLFHTAGRLSRKEQPKVAGVGEPPTAPEAPTVELPVEPHQLSLPGMRFRQELEKRYVDTKVISGEAAYAAAVQHDAAAQTAARRDQLPLEEVYSRMTPDLEKVDSLGKPTTRGATNFLENGKAIIQIAQSGNIDTIVHELMHVYRKSNVLSESQMARLETWAGVKDGKWNAIHEEKWALAGSRYLQLGKAPIPRLQGVFDQFREWLTRIFKGFKNSPTDLKLSPEFTQLMDEMYGKYADMYPSIPAGGLAGKPEVYSRFNVGPNGETSGTPLRGLLGEPPAPPGVDPGRRMLPLLPSGEAGPGVVGEQGLGRFEVGSTDETYFRDTPTEIKPGGTFGEADVLHARELQRLARAERGLPPPRSVTEMLREAERKLDLPISKTLYQKVELLPPEAAPEALEFQESFNRAEVEKANKSKWTWDKAKKVFQVAITDVGAVPNIELRKLGGEAAERAILRKDNTRGSTDAYKQAMDADIKPIFFSRDMSAKDKKNLDSVIAAMSRIETEKRKPNIGQPTGQEGVKSQRFLSELERLNPTEFKRLTDKALIYAAKFKKNTIDFLFSEGLLTTEGYAELERIKIHTPREFIDYLDSYFQGFSSRSTSVGSSGLKPLGEGYTGSLNQDAYELAKHAIGRTYDRVFDNRASRMLPRVVEENPNNGVFEKVPVRTKGEYPKPPPGKAYIYYFESGVKKAVLTTKEVADGWVKTDPAMKGLHAQVFGWLSGAKAIKLTAVGLNPEFAVTNPVRDLAHNWVVFGGNEYSSNVPLFVAQYANDLRKVTKDVFSGKGRVIEAIDEGIGMDLLTKQGFILDREAGALGSAQHYMGWLGNKSELWARIAIRERVIENRLADAKAAGRTVTPEELIEIKRDASAIARGTADFAKGGSFTKVADVVFPFLNPAVRITAAVGRKAITQPGVLLWQVAQIGMLSMALGWHNATTGKEAYDGVSAGDKSRNFILTSSLPHLDAEGNKKWTVFKFPKDQGQRLISSLFEGLARKLLGAPVSAEQLSQSAQDAIPFFANMPPTMAAYLGVMVNKDFWLKEDIWRGPRVEASQEFRLGKTNPALVKLGAATGLSPDRTAFALQQFFTRSNMFADSFAYAGQLLGDEEYKALRPPPSLAKIPGIRKVMGETNPYTKYRDSLNDIRVAEETRLYSQQRSFDSLVERALKSGDPEAKAAVRGFILEQPAVDRKRLHERQMDTQRLQGVPDRAFWLQLKTLPTPEARAYAYFARWFIDDEAGRKQLDYYARRVPGIRTQRFAVALGRLKRQSRGLPSFPDPQLLDGRNPTNEALREEAGSL